MSINKEQLAYEGLDGESDPATGGFVLPGMIGYSPGIGLPFDPQQARDLLIQAGYPNGQGLPNLVISWHSENRIIRNVIEQWKTNLNVKVDFRLLEWKEVIEEFQQGKFGYLFYGGATYDGETDGYDVIRVGVRLFLPTWHNEAFDHLMEEAKQISRIIDRQPLTQQSDKILINDAGVLPLLYERDHYLVKPWVKFPHGFNPRVLKDIIIEPH